MARGNEALHVEHDFSSYHCTGLVQFLATNNAVVESDLRSGIYPLALWLF